MPAAAYVGAVAPESLVLNVVPGQSALNLSTVTAATFHVQRPDGSTVLFPAVLSNQAASSLTLTYTYNANGQDLLLAGSWVVVAFLTVPGGTIRTYPTQFFVATQFAVG